MHTHNSLPSAFWLWAPHSSSPQGHNAPAALRDPTPGSSTPQRWEAVPGSGMTQRELESSRQSASPSSLPGAPGGSLPGSSE